MASIFLFYLSNIRNAVYYMIYCLLLWLILKNPVYSGPTKIIKVESKEHFMELIGKPEKNERQTKKSSEGKDFSKTNHCIAIFNAIYSDNCYYTYSLWAKMAEKYTTSRLKFVEINVSDLDSLAR